MKLEVGDIFVYECDYHELKNRSKTGIVLDIMGKIHHDIDDVCLTVLFNGKITEEWQSFLLNVSYLDI